MNKDMKIEVEREVNAWQKTTAKTVFRANIDSINIACDIDPGELFSDKEKYEIVLLKRKKSGFEDPAKYFALFGRSMFNTVIDKNGQEKKVCPYIDIYAIRAAGDTKIRVVVPAAKKDRHIIEFAGLQQYDNNADEMVKTVLDLWNKMKDFSLNRIDIAIDFWGDLPAEIEANILKSRKKERYKNTVYYSSKKQKTKRNTYVNILSYSKTDKNKHLQQNGEKITRLEFQFRSIIKDYKVRDFRKAKQVMTKYILKIAGIKVTIRNIPKLIYKRSLTGKLKHKKTPNSIKILNENILKLQKEISEIKHELTNIYIFYTILRAYRLELEQILNRMKIEREYNTKLSTMQKKYVEYIKWQNAAHEEMSGKVAFLSIKLNELQTELREIKENNNRDNIEWTTLSVLAEQKGLTKDAIRKQLQGGNFEEGVDFKSDGNKIIVHQGAIGRIQRQRRSSNG